MLMGGHSWARDMGQSTKLVEHCSPEWGNTAGTAVVAVAAMLVAVDRGLRSC